MKIGGLQKFSLIECPGKISAIIFTQGCNFRCPYCHNPELVDYKLFNRRIDENYVLSFLRTRVGKLDCVVITGGEPTLQKDVVEFIDRIKQMGFFIEVETNGSRPEVLKELIDDSLVDYIAMDIKAPLEKYHEIVGVEVDLQKIKKSIELIKKLDNNYEFRTTAVKPLLVKEDFIEIGKLLKNAELYILQKFISSKTLNPTFVRYGRTYSDEELYTIKEEVERYVKKCIVR